ncbi:hypothetical protein, partial [Streptomyces sp. SID161]|uniref:hypothetical protein n=1 Tax=Streptomyces sp. SID161 TaxID=2690251 RepID=UPI00136AF419
RQGGGQRQDGGRRQDGQRQDGGQRQGRGGGGGGQRQGRGGDRGGRQAPAPANSAMADALRRAGLLDPKKR